MADISQTAASVLPGTGAKKQRVTWGEAAITAGMCVYKDASTSPPTWKKALATAAASLAQAGADGIGVAASGGGTGQPGEVIRSGPAVALGATLTVGARYYASKNNAGAIMPESDLATTNRVTLLGVAVSASALMMTPIVSGIQVP